MSKIEFKFKIGDIITKKDPERPFHETVLRVTGVLEETELNEPRYKIDILSTNHLNKDTKAVYSRYVDEVYILETEYEKKLRLKEEVDDWLS